MNEIKCPHCGEVFQVDDKAQDLTIKRLTKDNPTMREKFEEAGISIT